MNNYSGFTDENLPKMQCKEEKSLKKTINAVSWVIIFDVILMLVSTIVIVRFISPIFAKDLSEIGINFAGIKPIAYFLSLGIAMIIYGFIPAFILKKTLNISFNELLPFKKVKKLTATSYVFVGLAFCYFANIVVDLLLGSLKWMHIPIPNIEMPYSDNPIAIIINFVCVSILAAVFEEFAFRGVILGSLRRYGNTFAIIVSSLFFGLIHGNIIQIPFAFLIGVIMAIIVVKTNSLIPSIIIHFANNFTSCIFEIIQKNYNENILIIASCCFYLLMIILGIISFVYLTKKDKLAFSPQESTSLLSNKQKFICTITSYSFILAIFVLLGVTLTSFMG